MVNLTQKKIFLEKYKNMALENEKADYEDWINELKWGDLATVHSGLILKSPQ